MRTAPAKNELSLLKSPSLKAPGAGMMPMSSLGPAPGLAPPAAGVLHGV